MVAMEMMVVVAMPVYSNSAMSHARDAMDAEVAAATVRGTRHRNTNSRRTGPERSRKQVAFAEEPESKHTSTSHSTHSVIPDEPRFSRSRVRVSINDEGTVPVESSQQRRTRLSHRPVTPVLLPSQVRWPLRENTESREGGRLHQRSRSYDSATYRNRMDAGLEPSQGHNGQRQGSTQGHGHRYSLGTYHRGRPATTVQELISRYATAEQQPLAMPGTWFGPTPGAPHDKRAAPRSPSPPRRRHRHRGRPTSAVLDHTSDQSETPEVPRRRRRQKPADNPQPTEDLSYRESLETSRSRQRRRLSPSDRVPSSESILSDRSDASRGRHSDRSDTSRSRQRQQPIQRPPSSESLASLAQSDRSSASRTRHKSGSNETLSNSAIQAHSDVSQSRQRHRQSSMDDLSHSKVSGSPRNSSRQSVSPEDSSQRYKSDKRSSQSSQTNPNGQGPSKRPKRPGYSPMQTMNSQSERHGSRQSLLLSGQKPTSRSPETPQNQRKSQWNSSPQEQTVQSHNERNEVFKSVQTLVLGSPQERQPVQNQTESIQVQHQYVQNQTDSPQVHRSRKSLHEVPENERLTIENSQGHRNRQHQNEGHISGQNQNNVPQVQIVVMNQTDSPKPPQRRRSKKIEPQSQKLDQNHNGNLEGQQNQNNQTETDKYHQMIRETPGYDREGHHDSSRNRRPSPPEEPELQLYQSPLTSLANSAFARGLGFKPKASQSPKIRRVDGNRRSLGSQRSEKRFNKDLPPARARSQTPTPEQTAGYHTRSSTSQSPQKVLLGHITNLSHSFSFGSRRKNSKTEQSLVVSDAVDFPTKKLNGAPSATSILHPAAGHPAENGGPHQHGQRSARWAIGFDRLLEDRAGLATFTEFLKKEFSQENIDFWVKCESYKECNDEEERQAEAKRLWALHLSQHSSESVNVDAATLAGVEQDLEMAPPTLFDDAQNHIFQLMKQDSYPRFLKSELYKTCVVAEMEGRPLPYLGPDEEAPRPRDEKKITKSKSTVSMDKGKRRQSFFPFTWNKSKSEKRLVKPGDADGNQRWVSKQQDGTVRVGVGSLDLVDLSVMSREIRAPSSPEDEKDENSNHGNKEVKLCRVILPDGSTTVLHIKAGTPIRANLQHLCQRRTLSLPTLEVFQHGTDKVVDLSKDASALASKEIRVEQRVLFQADLPTRRPLVVRARPSISLREALKPVLPKYNCKVDNMVAHLVGSDAAIDLDAAVSKVEGQRLMIQTEEDFAEWGGFGSHRGKPPVPARSKSTASLDSGADDDELLKDILVGKLDVAHLFDELGVFDPEKKHDRQRGEDGRTSGIFGFIRRNSIGEKEGGRLKNKNGPTSQRSGSQPATISGGELDRPRPRPRPPIKDREAENLFEQLNKLSGRLDDQRGDKRGLSRAELELPDFLKVDKEDHDSGEDRPLGQGIDPTRGSFRTRERRSSESSILDAETSRRLAQSISQENVNGISVPSSGQSGSPTSNRIPYMDQSFSQDGVVPSHAEADSAFATARHYPGSPDLNHTWTGPSTGNSVLSRDAQWSQPHRPRRTGNAKSPARRAYSPRSRTPDPKRTLLQEVNGYSRSHQDEDEDDLSVRPLPQGDGAPCDQGLIPMEIAEYSPPVSTRHAEKPTPRARKPAPLPPPRKTLTTPKKFLPPPSPMPVAGARHSHQNSTSSELSHHSTVSGGSGVSPSSTPSPSTHDLLVGAEGSSPEHMASPRRTRPQPPPRPSRRGHGASGSGSSSADEGGRQTQKSLNFQDQNGPSAAARQKEGADMQVSYV